MSPNTGIGAVHWNVFELTVGLTMVLYKAVLAVATGNTIIIKPSEDTSLVALRLGEVFCEAELPDGVFNIVTGLGETVGATLANRMGSSDAM